MPSSPTKKSRRLPALVSADSLVNRAKKIDHTVTMKNLAHFVRHQRKRMMRGEKWVGAQSLLNPRRTLMVPRLAAKRFLSGVREKAPSTRKHPHIRTFSGLSSKFEKDVALKRLGFLAAQKKKVLTRLLVVEWLGIELDTVNQIAKSHTVEIDRYGRLYLSPLMEWVRGLK